MTPANLTIVARLDGASFALRERVPLAVVLTNPGVEGVAVPDPFANASGAMTLVLRRPEGSEQRLSLTEGAAPPGATLQLLNVTVLPGQDTVFRFNVAALFALLSPGDHAITVEYAWAPGQHFRSPALPFHLRPPAVPGFFAVAPTEAASRGYQAVIWAEPGAATLLYDEGPQVLDAWGARPVASIPAGIRPAVSVAAAGQPEMDRWLVWVTGDRTLVATFVSEEPGRQISPQVTPLPASCRSGRLVHPALAGDPIRRSPDPGTGSDPDEEPARPPAAAVGLLVDGPTGGTDLVLARIEPSGRASFDPAVPVSADVAPDHTLGAWATLPSPGQRVFVLVVPVEAGVLVRGVLLQDGATTPPVAVDLATIRSDEFLLGDVRADLQGRVWIGLLLRRDDRWIRASFTPPVVDPVHDVRSAELDPDPGARPASVRLDTEGQLHVVYRSAGHLHYVRPDRNHATWVGTRPAMNSSFEHIVLREARDAVLVHHDRDLGLVCERMGP